MTADHVNPLKWVEFNHYRFQRDKERLKDGIRARLLTLRHGGVTGEVLKPFTRQHGNQTRLRYGLSEFSKVTGFTEEDICRAAYRNDIYINNAENTIEEMILYGVLPERENSVYRITEYGLETTELKNHRPERFLTRHERTPECEEGETCDECGDTFDTERGVQVHKSQVHKDD